MKFKELAALIKKKKNLDLKKLSYQLEPEDLQKLIGILQGLLQTPLSLTDSKGKSLTIIKSQIPLLNKDLKTLQTAQVQALGFDAMSQELYSSMRIEQIQTSRDRIKKILVGQSTPSTSESMIYQMKLSLDFISDPANEITESNIKALYQLVFKDQLDERNKPSAVTGYRDDAVYVVGEKMDHAVHTGIAIGVLPKLMDLLVAFARDPGELDDLTAAAVLHFYLAWLHPWFDGNGRMARLLHLWFLVQRGYPSALYFPFSKYVEASRKQYYEAFTLCEQNQNFLGNVDITPFVLYFNEHVYRHIELVENPAVSQVYDAALSEGKITVKETELWAFVISAYGSGEFSTKQLEKDFHDVAYQTIYKFVHKFESLGLLSAQAYGKRVRYRIKG